MTEPHRAVISRLSQEVDALSRQMYRVSSELAELDRVIGGATSATVTPPQATAPPQPTAAAPTPQPPHNMTPYWQPYGPQPWPQYWQPVAPPPRRRPVATPSAKPSPPKSGPPTQWIGKLLAVAGVGVTLVGVVLLLVLAANAGLLRPEIRVAGGIALSIALVGVAGRLLNRPGGRIGAIALAATGIAAAYLDVLAIATIYEWVPAAAGLLIAAVVGGAGLALARKWDSEHLGLLVLVPLIALAPVITDGVDLMLIGFMVTLSAAALPVQLGKDWTWMHAARIAAAAVPVLVALSVTNGHDNPWLLGGACAVTAILSVASGLILLPGTSHPAALALLTAAGTVPVLAAGIAVDHVFAAILAYALAAGMLTIVLVGSRLPRIATQVWSALSAVSMLVAITLSFDGYVAVPVLLALAIVVAVAGRRDSVARWVAAGFGVIGIGLYFAYAPLDALLTARVVPTHIAVSNLASSVLLTAFVVVMARVCVDLGRRDPQLARVLSVIGGGLVIYAATAFTVTAGVLIGGTKGGFLAGQMAATICWIGMAAALFVYALRHSGRDGRAAPITAGLTITAAATAKLFLFDLARLNGMFRVAAFIIVGLVLLAMGAGYARNLAQQGPPEQARAEP